MKISVHGNKLLKRYRVVRWDIFFIITCTAVFVEMAGIFTQGVPFSNKADKFLRGYAEAWIKPQHSDNYIKIYQSSSLMWRSLKILATIFKILLNRKDSSPGSFRILIKIYDMILMKICERFSSLIVKRCHQKCFNSPLFFFSLLRQKLAERKHELTVQQTPQFEGGNMSLVLFGFDAGD